MILSITDLLAPPPLFSLSNKNVSHPMRKSHHYLLFLPSFTDEGMGILKAQRYLHNTILLSALQA